MAEISPELRALRAEAGRRGAAARLLGLTTPEQRRELTAAASAARAAAGAAKRAGRPTVADRIAAVEAALPTMTPEERHRQIALLETIRGTDERIAELRERLKQYELDDLVEVS